LAYGNLQTYSDFFKDLEDTLQETCGSFRAKLTSSKKFVVFDDETRTLLLAPSFETPEGTYKDSSVKFFLSKSPDAFFELKITAIVKICKVQKLSFQPQIMQASYVIGKGRQEFSLPLISLYPNCVGIETKY